MKTIIFASLSFLAISTTELSAQETTSSSSSGESFGNTLNLGLGLGYYANTPVLHANYEINVAKNFTLAPFITYYSYRRDYYWGNPKYPYKNYHYRHTVIPIGVKGSYYFDELLNAGDKWDFYLGASLGFAIRSTTWESGYYGETNSQGTSGLYLDGHIGTELHLSPKAGLFLDLSSDISTFGLALHL